MTYDGEMEQRRAAQETERSGEDAGDGAFAEEAAEDVKRSGENAGSELPAEDAPEDVRPLADGLEGVDWGFAFLFLDLTFGRLNVLPDWVGFLLFREAFGALGDYEPELLLLKPLAAVLAAYDAVCWAAALLGSEIFIPAAEVVFTVVNLYFFYQFMTDLGKIATRFGAPKAGWFFWLRNVQAAVLTAVFLFQMYGVSLEIWPSPAEWFKSAWVFAMLVLIWCMVQAVGDLRKTIRQQAEEG